MKVVFDTNVLIAAFVARGTCADLLEHCSRSHELVTSEPLLVELQRVLTKKFGQRPSDARAVVSLLRTKCTVVQPIALDRKVCRDPDDPFRNLRVLAPAAFWKFEAEGEESG